jgi:hypothetical protein
MSQAVGVDPGDIEAFMSRASRARNQVIHADAAGPSLDHRLRVWTGPSGHVLHQPWIPEMVRTTGELIGMPEKAAPRERSSQGRCRGRRVASTVSPTQGVRG